MRFRQVVKRLTAWMVPLLAIAAIETSATAASPASDIIYLESNSTAGNSIFAYSFNFTSSPMLIQTAPAGGIGVFDGTFALGPFDSDQNLTEDRAGTLLF